MNTLENEVRSVVTSFMNSGELFTALDVSNKVKLTFPFARHREIRDMVRGMFTTDIETAGWARTPITVTLADGSTTEALLYHSVNDAWDLDVKYDAQKRSQGSMQNQSPVQVSLTLPVMTIAPVTQTTTAAPVTSQLTQAQAKDRWVQLFNSAPSLFPLK